ncbi:hypothetical protein OsI_14366 [Oryza sativa Indica Group]|uniref:Reverse transcriptase zinc-binding domain-containing protein n=1 Tax=Oryza sativa subsp. indica TaxID=39946 RepID=B8ANQ7_ORYSI|nr:hypothetical protein OsI_14366 [Oryza sativa Indica Group]
MIWKSGRSFKRCFTSTQLTAENDTMFWKLNQSGTFTTKSLYRAIIFGGIKGTKLQELWKTPVPLKIKVFMWLMLKGRIQVAKQLKKMNWSGSPFCAWSIWLVRNDWVFNDKLLTNVMFLPHKAMSFMIQWKNLAPVQLKEELEKVKRSLLANIRETGDSSS